MKDHRMKTFFFLLFLVLPLSATAESTQLKVGVVAPLSGSAASNGVTVRNSIQLAQEKFDSQKTIQFIFEDDQLGFYFFWSGATFQTVAHGRRVESNS